MDRGGLIISQSVKYRPEIDGLRAVAVLSVMLYHAAPSFLPGGFLGVDVFFVISGYLITGALMTSDGTLRQSLASFWMRRIRRIMPALLVCIAGTLLLGIAILPPTGLETLAKSGLAALFSVSNFYFWRQPRGYFHDAANDNPLIHTWSLGVEEQFYLLYPVALLLLLKYRRALVWPVLLAGSLASFVVAQWGAMYEPSAAFFLLPFRAWQLGAGALVWIALSKLARPDLGALARDGTAWAGLAAIAASFVLIRSNWLIPGLGALPVVAGAAAYIWASRADAGPGRLLAMRGPVVIGLISYSLYLWHQPLLALSRVAFADFETVRSVVAVMAIAIAFPIAWASWKFVELPMRSKTTPSRKVLARTGLGLGVSAALALVLVVTAGLPQRLDQSETRLVTLLDRENTDSLALSTCSYANEGWKSMPGACVSNQKEAPTIAVIGDSHASALFETIGAVAAQDSQSAVLLFSGGCRAVPERMASDPRKERCLRFPDEALRYLEKTPSIRTIIVSYHWNSLVETPDPILPDNGNIAHFRNFMTRLASNGRSLIIIDPVPMPEISGINAAFAATRMGRRPPAGLAYDTFRTRTAPVREVLDTLGTEHLARIDPSPYLCDAATNLCPMVIHGDVVYRDRHHLTAEGARLAVPAEVLLPLIARGRARE